LADLNGKVQLILQGGKSDGGIESTVVDCTGEFPIILRKGLVTKEMIESVCGRCEYAHYVEGQQVSSPGVMYAHYMQNCQTALFKVEEIEQAKSLYLSYIKSGKKPYFMCDFNVKSILGNGYNLLELSSDSSECASNLYEKLRDGERVADIIIAFELTFKDEIAQSVMNRLIKACGKGLYT
jgi:L-threonylcarbamoyladenylate synthase